MTAVSEASALDMLEKAVAVLTDRLVEDRSVLQAMKVNAGYLHELASRDAFATLFKELLLAIDRLEREELTEDLRSSVIDELVSVCERHGLEQIDADGVPNLRLHEIVGVVETDKQDADGHIALVARSGYRLAGKVLRPAQVYIWRYTAGA